ncbi:MAG: hypothetical protein O3C40_12665 [Planctomycetota bacterium]|nr:hypothetical protein [Planctomycetota bacterium]
MNKQVLLLVSLGCVSGACLAEAQVVQLPTYHVFSVNTTVSVPDGGAAYLGGVTRGTWSSSSRGVPGLSQVPGLNRLFTNRGIGSSVSSSHAYATATIIDHAEMDQMLLSEAAARRGVRGTASETNRRAAFLSEFVARRPESSTSRPRVANRAAASDVDSRLVNATAQHEADMASYLQRAEFAEAAGSFGAARCCYSVLARRGSDEQKQLATRRLAALKAPRTDDKLVSREP